jgi:hypothetical protein
MEITLPQYLYKIRRVDANALSMLAANSLYLAPVESFNDPFEVLFPWLNFEAGGLENPELSFHEFDAKYRATSRHNALRVCALTELRDDVVSWGHYADCHKGFCIQFDFCDDKRVAPLLFPVTYQAEIPKFSERPDSNEVVSLGLLTKSQGWSYEKEWRLIGHVSEAEPRRHMTIQYEPKSLVGIIFGMRMLDEHKMLIRKILGNHPAVRYMQAYKCHDRFSLIIRNAT